MYCWNRGNIAGDDLATMCRRRDGLPGPRNTLFFTLWKLARSLFLGAQIAIYTEGTGKLLVLVYIAKGQQEVRDAWRTCNTEMCSLGRNQQTDTHGMEKTCHLSFWLVPCAKTSTTLYLCRGDERDFVMTAGLHSCHAAGIISDFCYVCAELHSCHPAGIPHNPPPD